MKAELKENGGLPARILWTLAIVAGISVANLYYNQPLLNVIRHELGVSEFKTNLIAMITQIGYALGLLFIVPLGDLYHRKKIILTNFTLLIFSLIAIAAAPNIYIIWGASFVTGVCSMIPQIFVPIASQFSRPENKGRNVGVVISGLLTGILASRVISGFVGEGMIDISVAGNIFAAPGPQACVEAIKMADKGRGVLFVVLNHAGDMLTGNLTMKQVKKLGINVVKVVTQEDVANAPRENADDRRGLVGCVPLYKIAGAAAAAGKSLEEVAAIAQKFADNMATIAVATKGATHPATGMEIAHIAEGTMEIGMGQHGEGGGGTQPMKSADETAAIMMDALLKDLDVKAGEKLMVVINGSGATTLMEQLIVFRACHKLLAEKGIEVVASAVGEILTVQETAGFQMFIARMDDELLGYWNAPCRTPYYRN